MRLLFWVPSSVAQTAVTESSLAEDCVFRVLTLMWGGLGPGKPHPGAVVLRHEPMEWGGELAVGWVGP